ncbi:hypothetical protein M9H77_20042 [Catharanthus roseus]|uniref:Uncharacterized protein n=1 Tax=Catharanthus roseus TaxID=4058 RepID=A0ACC0AKM6_CATRO|nr:hypothetical protein M9H77_20042 [Catharanthus roseus]
MERNFHVKEELVAAGNAGVGVTTPEMSVEDAYVSGFFPELSFQSVLRPLSLTLANFSAYDGEGVSFHSQCQTSAVASSSPVRRCFLGEEFPKMETWSRRREVLDQRLKMPTIEEGSFNTKEFAFELLKLNSGATNDAATAAAFSEPLINFFTSSPPTSPSLCVIDGTDFTGHFSHLPQPQITGSDNKHIFYLQYPTESSSSSSFSQNQIKSSPMTMKRSPPQNRAAAVARHRRQKISDKMRSLEKLLPWNKRMDMAKVLEEAYKYVKFLQAQIRVLQSMPVYSTDSYSSSIANENLDEFGCGVLARLNRQQLLEVVMNSPVAQTVLYSRGYCVYSMEQLLLLKKMAEKAALEQMLFSSVQN